MFGLLVDLLHVGCSLVATDYFLGCCFDCVWSIAVCLIVCAGLVALRRLVQLVMTWCFVGCLLIELALLFVIDLNTMLALVSVVDGLLLLVVWFWVDPWSWEFDVVFKFVCFVVGYWVVYWQYCSCIRLFICCWLLAGFSWWVYVVERWGV